MKPNPPRAAWRKWNRPDGAYADGGGPSETVLPDGGLMQKDSPFTKPDAEIGLLPVGTRSRLRVAVKPVTAQVHAAQAFWDLHAGTIEHHTIPHDPYHSFIRGDGFRIETDAQGHPVFVELIVPRCLRGSMAQIPKTVPDDRAAIRFLDLRVRFHEQAITLDVDKAMAFIDLGLTRQARWVSSDGGSIWAVDSDSSLVGIIISGIRLDPTGGLKMAWRREAWQSWRTAECLRGFELPGTRAISIAEFNDPA